MIGRVDAGGGVADQVADAAAAAAGSGAQQQLDAKDAALLARAGSRPLPPPPASMIKDRCGAAPA